MKKYVALLLTLTALVSLVSCQPSISSTQTETVETETVTNESTATAPAVVATVAETDAIQKLNAIPIAKAGMSEEQLRQICADFMRLQLSFAWTPSKNSSYQLRGEVITLKKGTAYGGLPYISSTKGNIYNALLFYDEQTGVVSMEGLGDFSKVIGNQCSSSAYWAWARVADRYLAGGSPTTLHKNGALRLGPYTYSDAINNFHEEGIDTVNICKDNGEKVMYESYAKLKAADGMVQYRTSHGHVIMAASNAEVVRDGNGNIDPVRSNVLILEQVSDYKSKMQSNSKPMQLQGGIDNKYSFEQLYKSGYLPFTIAELCGKDDVENSEVSFSIKENQATVTHLKDASIASNYPLANATITVQDQSGKTVYQKSGFYTELMTYSATLSPAVSPTALKKYVGDAYRVKAECRIGNGEIHTLWEGSLIAE